MKTVDVLYFIEHAAREFDIACIVKYICETKYGLSVKIASLPLEVKSVIHQYQPHIVAVPYFYSVESWAFPPIVQYWKNLTYLNLNYEQHFAEINEKIKAPGDSFTRSEVIQYVWTESFKGFLIKNGVRESNIFVSGNPSYMLYQEPYRHYFPTKKELAVKHKLDWEKLWLFFPENYGWAFLSYAEIESHIRQGYDSRIAYEYRELNQKSLKEVIHWFNHISQNRNMEIIVRPRPAVTEKEYVRELGKELGRIPQSIHIIKDGSIREWNLASDIVVSSFSTSLLEAVVANKPAYMLEPYPIPEWVQADWYDLIPHITSLEAFESICCQEPDNTSAHQARDYVMQTNLSQGDAIAHIARILYDLRQVRDSPAEYIPSKQPFQALLREFLVRAKIKSYKMLRAVLNRVVSTASEGEANIKYNRFEKDKFTEREVDEKVKLWGSVLKSQS